MSSKEVMTTVVQGWWMIGKSISWNIQLFTDTHHQNSSGAPYIYGERVS
jgi:hypothetical protein